MASKENNGRVQYAAHADACQAVAVIFNAEALTATLHKAMWTHEEPAFSWNLFRALSDCKRWHDNKKKGLTDYLPNFVLIIYKLLPLPPSSPVFDESMI